MSTPGDINGEEPRDDVIAAEYVLGLLSSQERHAAERRMRQDRAFATLVYDWQVTLETLDSAYGAEMPPASVLGKIEDRLFDSAMKAENKRDFLAGMWNSIALWRGVSVAAVILVAVTFIYQGTPFVGQKPGFVAELSGEDNAVNLVARYNARNGVVTVTPVAAGAANERSLELWLVEDENPPVSLGVLPQSGEGELKVPRDIKADIGAGAYFAVSIEPYGGSQTGQPTGPVIAVGELQSL
ncbi:anti-sigma factor [Martelella mediterranea]|uniref:Anti-sigma-K factor RskA n=1 Tax=Martelella mediterranea TaxID=293089 RepID=A0A4V2V4T5_9HYPH|nr:anti-sigma factor [Martelella mediterranea]TCT43072.1 anti-sigma-K factor RskA [Martelella mediterranea]